MPLPWTTWRVSRAADGFRLFACTKIAGLPDAAPFVDIKGAFHYLARELALRMSIPLPEVLKHVLTVENIDPALLAAHLGDAPELNGWIIPYLFDVLFKMPTPSPGRLSLPPMRCITHIVEQGQVALLRT